MRARCCKGYLIPGTHPRRPIQHAACALALHIDPANVSVRVRQALVVDGRSVAAAGFSADDLRVCFIRSASWTTAQLGQTENHPCKLNTIRVTLAASVPIFNENDRCPNDITLTGIGKTLSCKERLDVQMKDASGNNLGASIKSVWVTYSQRNNQFVKQAPTSLGAYPDNSRSSNTYQQGTLKLQPTATMVAGTPYVFEFDVMNPPHTQNHTITVEKGTPVTTSALSDAPYVPEADVSGLFEVVEAKIAVDSFVQADQNPCGEGAITLTISSNVDLPEKCVPSITISGLDGTETTTTELVGNWAAAGTGAGGSTSRATFDSWDSSSGVLEVKNAIVYAADPLAVTFTLKNKKLARPVQPVAIAGALNVDDAANKYCDLQTADLAQSSAAGYTVDCVNMSLTVDQSSPDPCFPANVIRVTLTPQQALKCPGEKITVSGLGCRATADTDSMELESESDTAFKSPMKWRQDGTAIVELKESIAAGSAKKFWFKVTNPAKTCQRDLHTKPVVSLGSAATCTGGLTIAAADLNVTAASFEGTSALAASNTPCDENTITVTLRSSVDLYRSCMPEVTISGLKYSPTPPNEDGLLPAANLVSKDNAKFSNLVRWDPDAGELTFPVLDTVDKLDDGTDYVFSFKLENPSGFSSVNPSTTGWAQTPSTAITAPNPNITVHADLIMGKPWAKCSNRNANCNCEGLVRRGHKEEDDWYPVQQYSTGTIYCGDTQFGFSTLASGLNPTQYECQCSAMFCCADQNAVVTQSAFRIVQPSMDFTVSRKWDTNCADVVLTVTGTPSDPIKASKCPVKYTLPMSDINPKATTSQYQVVSGTTKGIKSGIDPNNPASTALWIPGISGYRSISVADCNDTDVHAINFQAAARWSYYEVQFVLSDDVDPNMDSRNRSFCLTFRNYCPPTVDCSVSSNQNKPECLEEAALKPELQCIDDSLLYNAKLKIVSPGVDSSVFPETAKDVLQGRMRALLDADTTLEAIEGLKLGAIAAGEIQLDIRSKEAVWVSAAKRSDYRDAVVNAYKTAMLELNQSAFNVSRFPGLRPVYDGSTSATLTIDLSTSRGLLAHAEATEAVPEFMSRRLLQSGGDDDAGCMFLSASARQSNPFPCHLNTITASFSTTLSLRQGTNLTVEGLLGVKTENEDNLRIFGPSVSDGSLKPYGRWSKSAGTLAVSLERDSAEYSKYEFSFEITNPAVEGTGKSTRLLRGAADLTIVASDQCTAKFDMEPDLSTCLWSTNKVFGAQPGDAAPLVVLRGLLLTKKIGQSSPFAGCMNSISVTLSTSVPITSCANIKLSGFFYNSGLKAGGLEGMEPASGPIALSAAHGKCAGRERLGFGRVVGDAFEPGVGTWDKGSASAASLPGYPGSYLGQLTVVPEVETIPLQEYVFSFEIENPSKEQSVSSPVHVEIEGMDIGKTLMDHEDAADLSSADCCSRIGQLPGACFASADGPTVADTEPLKIVAPQFCVKSIVHDNPYPCDLNCLTVTVQTNAALMAGKSRITIDGLAGATFCAPGSTSCAINLTDASGTGRDHEYFTSGLSGDDDKTGIGRWEETGTTRRLVLHLAKDAGCGQQFAITFCVYNPAKYQNDPAIRIMADDVGRSKDVYTASTRIDPVYMDKEKLGGSDYIALPLRVKYPFFDAEIGQTSSVPCDANTLTITLRSTVPLLDRCAPCVSISGLNPLDYPHDSDGNALVGDARNVKVYRDAVWDSGAGEYQDSNGAPAANVSSTLVTYTTRDTSGACSDTSSALQFCMRGVHSVREFMPLGVSDTESSMRAQFKTVMTVDITNKNVEDASAFDWVGFDLYFAPSPPTWNVDTGKYTASTITFPGYTTTGSTAVTSSAWDYALSIDTVSFVTGISVAGGSSNTMQPCAEETVTVTLEPSTSIFKKCAAADVSITLSGFKSAAGTDRIFQPRVNSDGGAIENLMTIGWAVDGGSATELSDPVAFTESTGTLVIPVDSIDANGCSHGDGLCANQVYSISFTRKVLEDAGDKSLQVSVQTSATMCSAQYVGHLYVECFDWTELAMGQSSYYPCAANTITVTLNPSIAILGTCNSYTSSTAMGTEGFPTITLTGFDHDGSTSTHKAVFTNGDADLTFLSSASVGGDTTGAWDLSAGTLTIEPTATMAAGAQVVFTFDVTNSPRFNDDALDVRVKVDRFDTVCCSGGSYASGCPLGEVFLLNPDFATFSSITQSSPYPCAHNTITVDLFSSVPFLTTECAPKITVQGLTRTCTADAKTSGNYLTVTPDSTGTATTGAWDHSDGQLVVDVAGDDDQTDGGVTAAAVDTSTMLSGGTTDTEGVRATWADVDEFTRPDAGTTVFKYWRRTFTFVLKNPAAGDASSKEQMAPSVSVTASFEKTDYAWAWTARDTTDRPDYTEYYSGLLTSAASGTAFSKDPKMYGRFNMTSTGSPGYDYRDAATTPYIDQGAPYTWTQVYVAGKPAGFENYPLYMMPLRFEAFVGQSSPFPCDDNTLTLFVQTNVPLLKACAPKLTLSSLTGSSTVSNTADGASGFGVEFHVTPGYTTSPTWRGDVATTAGTAVPKTGSGEGVTYSVSDSTGSLVLDLEKVLPDITTPSDLEKLESGDTNTDATVDQLYVTFVLKNKNGYNACASPQVRLGFTGCSTNTATQLQTTSGLTSTGESSLHLQSPADTSGHIGVFYPPGKDGDGVTEFPSVVGIHGGFDSTRFNVDVDGVAFAQVQPGEGRPMCIRAPEFKCIPAHQSTFYPCAANTVTVTLQSFVPIFATCGGSPNKIQIRELDIFQTEADVAAINTAAAVTVDDGAQAGGDNSVATGAWTAETTIEVTMETDQTMKAEEEFVVTFTRNNVQNRGANRGSEVNLAVALTTMTHTAQTSLPTGRPDPAIGTANSNGVQAAPHVEAATPYRINSCFDYLFLYEPGCMAQTIHQTSAYPCAENTVTVALRPDVPLLATCGNSAAARARPTITIAGFDRDQAYSRSTTGTPWHIWSGSTNGGNYKSMFTDVTTTDMVADMAFLEGSAATAVADPTGGGGAVQTLGVSATTPEYNQVSGHVIIALETDWTANMVQATTNYLAFQFKVKNSPRFSNDAPDVRVFVSGLENPASCHLGSLYIKDPYLATFSSVTQSSPYPCATNTITVDLWSSVPFLDDCVPKVTIAGLAGACTDSATTDASTLIGNQDPASGVDLTTTGKTPTWTQNTGTLVVTMKEDFDAEDFDAFRVEAAVDGSSPGPAAGISGEFYASGAPTRTMPDPVYGTEQSLASAAGIEYEYIDGTGTRSIIYFRRSFTLTLTNAATDRDAGQVTLRASFNMASNAQDWCQVRDSQWSDSYGPPAGFAVNNGAYCDQIELRSEGWDEATLSRTTGTHPTGTLWDTFKGRPYYDFAEYTNYGDLPWQVPAADYPSELGASTSQHALYAPFPKPVDYARYPTYVMPVRLRAFAAQSSPFPCDTANTITVWVQTNVPLLKRCQPKLTVSNLRGRQESGAITVTTHTGGASIGGDKAGSYTGAWTYDSSGSKMVLDLVPASSPMLDGNEPQVLATFGTAAVDASGGIAAAITAAETASPAEHDLATVDVLLMTFPIENQRNARDYAIPNVEIRLATTDNTATGTECAIGSSQTTVTTDYGMDGGTPAADGAS